MEAGTLSRGPLGDVELRGRAEQHTSSFWIRGCADRYQEVEERGAGPTIVVVEVGGRVSAAVEVAARGSSIVASAAATPPRA